MTVFYNRYCELCANVGKSVSGVASAIGLSNAAANGWKNGKIPNDTTLAKLSAYFGVTTGYLLGTEGKKEKLTLQPESELDPVTQELFEIVNNSDEDELKALLEMARLIRKRRIE